MSRTCGAVLVLIAFMVAGLAPSAQGAVFAAAVETGGDVVFSGAGTLNLSAWSPDPNNPHIEFARIDPDKSLILGPPIGTSTDRYISPVSFMGPSDFGTAGNFTADSGSDGVFGLNFGAPILFVPAGYLSGAVLQDSSTYTGETFASLGMEVGIYRWSWGTGDNADSFTLQVVPEPSTAALTALGLIGLASRRRRP